MVTLKDRLDLFTIRLGNYLRDSILPRLVPSGGNSYQVLQKTSTADYSVSWADKEQFIALTSAYTLTSQTGLQKLFNSTANGALTVLASTTYFFECELNLSAMSVTSGTFSFGFGGTATLSSIKYTAHSNKAVITTPTATLMSTIVVSTGAALVTANTVATGHSMIRGIIRVNSEGTLIPSVGLSIASAAIVGANSWFRITPVGTNTVTNIGNWN